MREYNARSINDQYAEIEPMTEENQIPVDYSEMMQKLRSGEIKLDFSHSIGIEDTVNHSSHNHYFIDVSDVDEIDFYEIALRYNVTDPCIQHILKKCLAVGNRGHKDFHTDLKDIHDTAKRMLDVHGLDS